MLFKIKISSILIVCVINYQNIIIQQNTAKLNSSTSKLYKHKRKKKVIDIHL